MRINYLFFVIIILFMSCKDDNEISYPDSAMPEIIVKSDELYSVPNRKFVINAGLKDDLGLKTLKISIPELYLDKEIEFPTDELLTEYELAYEFLAPVDTKENEKYKVTLTLTDVSSNSISKELILNLNGDFDAPAFNSLKPADRSVLFATEDMQLNISFNVTDITGIDYVEVIVEELNINEKISVGGAKEYTFNQTFIIPSDLKTYEISITAVDNFVEPNKVTRNVQFSIADGLTELYLADVSKDTDLTADIFGMPIYYHKKVEDVFTFKYFADSDNKKIYFLGQETSFEPHCFGDLENGKLENNISASPVVLPEKGYYLITVDVASMSYTIAKYIPTSPIYNPAQITICGNGLENGGWDPNNTDLLLSANSDNPYQLERSLTLTGSDVAMTITSPDWGSPWWRLDAQGVIVFAGGANHSYKGAVGTYKFVMDTELERAVLVKE